MKEILSRLYIGSFQDAQNPAEFITARLNVAEERQLPENKRILDKKVPVKDMTPIPFDQLSESVMFIKNNIAHHAILVSCNAGVGRSPSVVIAYLCLCGFGFGEAVEFVACKKHDISILPNLIEGINYLTKKD